MFLDLVALGKDKKAKGDLYLIILCNILFSYYQGKNIRPLAEIETCLNTLIDGFHDPFTAERMHDCFNIASTNSSILLHS